MPQSKRAVELALTRVANTSEYEAFPVLASLSWTAINSWPDLCDIVDFGSCLALELGSIFQHAQLTCLWRLIARTTHWDSTGPRIQLERLGQSRTAFDLVLLSSQRLRCSKTKETCEFNVKHASEWGKSQNARASISESLLILNLLTYLTSPPVPA